MPALAYVLRNRSLKELALGSNRIGEAGAEIARALPEARELRSLGKASNQIGVRARASRLTETMVGAAYLGWTVGSMSRANKGRTSALEELWLSANAIGEEGAKALAAGLPRVGRLSKLDLRFNPVADGGAAALALALPEMAALRELYLQDCGNGDEAPSRPRAPLTPATCASRTTRSRPRRARSPRRRRRAARKLHLSANKIADAGGEAFARMRTAPLTARAGAQPADGRARAHRRGRQVARAHRPRF